MRLKRIRNSFLAGDNLKNINGTKEARDFFNVVCLNTINGLKKYYKDMPSDYKEHGFQYTEQPIKSFLTPAIYAVTEGSFLQECPIDRYEQKGRRTKKVHLGYGHLDYWANYNNCSFLIEVKHFWIRYYPRDNYFTFYSKLQDRLDSAVKQIKKMHAKTHYNYRKRLFALGLVIAPVFVRGEDVKKLYLKKQIIEVLENETLNMGANALGFWSLEKDFLFVNEFKNEEGKKIKEFYPGLAFIGKFKKITKN